jgi:hypothetical protein
VFLSWHSDLLIEAQIITFNLDQFYPVRSVEYKTPDDDGGKLMGELEKQIP